MSLMHTRAIRAIMKQHQCARLFTNKYKTMRSVKCYAPQGAERAALMQDLQQYLDTNNVPGKVVTTKGPSSWGRWESIIVQLPLE